MPSLSRREWLALAAQAGASAQVVRPSSAEPHFWTACEAADQIRRRKISSEELTRLCLDRIAKYDRKLNAFITLTADRALDEARACDRDMARKTVRGPLHGVPIALKDNIDTAGIKTTAASTIFADRVPAENAEVAQRVLGAGAVLLGKLNLDEWAFAGTGTTGCFGPAHNPWSLDRITGGSSAGSAAALAGGLCFGSIGSDDGGSVRIPAAHCGIVGFKPTFSRASTRGIIPSAYSLDCPGPMARSVEDVALLLGLMAGHDPQDAIVANRSVPDYSRALRDSVANLRIGVPRTYYFETLDADVASSVEAAIALLRKKTREVRDVTLPSFRGVQGGGTDIELYHYHKQFFDAAPEKYHAWSRRLLERAKTTSAERYVETLKLLRESRRDIRKIFEQVDVLVLPTMREPAPLISETMEETHRRPPSNTGAFNRFGLPAVTVPCGFSRQGLPIGLQIAGAAFGESTVLALAYWYQRWSDWREKHPAF